MEARPTQFKGKLFKSKTEAMYAFILEKKKNEYSRWYYEPERFKTPKGYIPDFIEHEGVEHFLSDFTTLIEVKPTYPTEVYYKYLAEQFDWIRKNDKFYFISFYAIVVFNPYKRIFKQCEMFDSQFYPEDFHSLPWFKPEWFDEALSYRFDLE